MSTYILNLSAFARATADLFLYAYLPIYLYSDLGEQRFWVVMLLISAPGCARLLMAPLWGRWSDRCGQQRPFLIIGLFAYAALLFALPKIQHPTTVLLCITASAFIFAAFNPTARAWLTLVDPANGVRSLARWHQSESAGYLLGGIFLGWGVSGGGVTLPWVAGSISFLLLLCMVLIVACVRDKPTQLIAYRSRQAPLERPIRHRRYRSEGSSFTAMELKLAVPLLFVFLSSLGWESVAAIFGLYFTQFLGGPPVMYGFVLSTSTFCALVAYGGLAQLSKRKSPGALFQGAALGYSLMYSLLLWPSSWSAAAAYLIPMSAVVRTGFHVLLTRHVSDHQRAEAMGWMEGAEAAAMTIGPLMGGILADAFGISTVISASLLGSMLLHLFAFRLRRTI